MGDTPGELVVRSSLVCTGHSGLISLAVYEHVFLVALLELGHVRLHNLHAARIHSGFSGDVGMETGTVPFFFVNWLGVEGDFGAKLFGDTFEDEAGDPELVSTCLGTDQSRCGLSRLRIRFLPAIPLHGPIWYSHWAGMTSALVPEISRPAYKQAR